MDGLDPTYASLYIPIPIVYCAMLYICMGGMDKGQYGHDSQLPADILNRRSSLHKDDYPMTVYKQQHTNPQLIKHWHTGDGRKFELLATYSPNEDNDVWVEYRNTTTGETYTCRQAAFTQRYSPLPD